MNVNHLRFFLATVDEGSITAAAQRCFVTQPTLSAGLASLEKELGGKLLERSKRGVKLTRLGKEVLETAREIVHRVGFLRSAAQQKQQRYMRLAVADCMPAEYLLNVCQVCQARVDEIRLVETDVNEGVELLRSGRADVLLTSALEKESELPGRVLEHDRHGIILPVEHPLSRKKKITAQDMHQQNMIVRMHSEETWAATQILRQAKSSPQVIARVHSDAKAYALVAAGLGVCVMPQRVFDRLNSDDSVVWRDTAQVKLTRYVQLLWQDNIWQSICSADFGL